MSPYVVPKIRPKNRTAKRLLERLHQLGEQGRVRLGVFGVTNQFCIGVMLGNLDLPQVNRKLYELGQHLGNEFGKIEFSSYGCSTILVFVDAHAQAWHETPTLNHGDIRSA